MRLAVTGKSGQVVTSLVERSAGTGIEVIPLGRPEFDLGQTDTIKTAFLALRPDAIVSAAAYTAVDKAESEKEAAFAINGTAPGLIGEAGAEMGIPVVHLSTDYVFDGSKTSPYVETDPTGPLGAYGQSKLAGELTLAAGTANHAILRTAWVYSPFGNNFLKTMLRLAGERAVLRVVADQQGTPTSALDIADAVLKIASALVQRPRDDTLRGIFHMVATGQTNWAQFAQEIMENSRRLGGPVAQVEPITAAQYPTPAPRPANSQLATEKLADAYGIRLPAWQPATAETVKRLLANR
jgi:dTDP-4-dehydrorhamnose reductase